VLRATVDDLKVALERAEAGAGSAGALPEQIAAEREANAARRKLAAAEAEGAARAEALAAAEARVAALEVHAGKLRDDAQARSPARPPRRCPCARCGAVCPGPPRLPHAGGAARGSRRRRAWADAVRAGAQSAAVAARARVDAERRERQEAERAYLRFRSEVCPAPRPMRCLPPPPRLLLLLLLLLYLLFFLLLLPRR
jgi:hypothetical protein